VKVLNWILSTFNFIYLKFKNYCGLPSSSSSFIYKEVIYPALFGQKPFTKVEIDDVTISCSNRLDKDGCLKYSPKFTDVKKSSNYTVSSIAYAPVTSFTSGTLVDLDKDLYSS
jgi:hypothetical protein